MKKENILYIICLALFCAGLLPLVIGGADWFWLVVLLHAAGFALFVITALTSLIPDTREKYVKMYKICGLALVVSIPTVIGPFLAIGVIIGLTTLLIFERFEDIRIRIGYFIITLGLTVVYLIVNIITFIAVRNNPSDELLYPLFGIILGSIIFLALATAFAIKGIMWVNSRKYTEERVQKANRDN